MSDKPLALLSFDYELCESPACPVTAHCGAHTPGIIHSKPGEPANECITFDAMETLEMLGAKISPAFSRPGPLNFTSRDCVICGPEIDCICATIEFGSPEYFARLDRLHGRKR